MNDFFATPEGAWGDGSVRLTVTGVFLVAAIILLLIVTAALLRHRNGAKKAAFTTKQLVYSAAAIALAAACSMIKLFEVPMGGSVTLFSMFFICYVGYLYGVKVGIITAFAYSILQFIQSGSTYFLTPFQVCCDYFFAFTALGLAGIFYKKKHGLTIGYLTACLFRGLFHTIGGYIYWMDYMPEWFPKALTSVYPIIYNYSYILAEMIITLIIINLPPVKKALERVKEMALS